MIRAAVMTCAVVAPLMAGAPVWQSVSGGEQSAESKLRFDVASVKPNELGSESYLWAFRNGRFTARYATLKALIRSAYGGLERTLGENQVVGGPSWLNVDRFDVEATAPEVPDSPRGTFPTPVLAMLRNLLEERFALETHSEIRESPLFALVLSRQDGTPGRRLQRRTTPCIPAAVGVMPGASRDTCGGRVGLGTLVARGATMTNLVGALSQMIPGVDRTVVDRTGLTGTFDVDLRWTPEATTVSQGAAPVLPLDPNLPSLFTALHEQLGLKLERTTGPLEILVIDHVERPTAN